MEWAFDVVSLDKAIAQLGIAVAAQVVYREHFAFHAEQRDILSVRGHWNARTFEQVGLCGHINPLGHGQIG